jgi:hypothetical protein
MGKFFASADRFSAHLDLLKTPKAGNLGISCHFRIGSGLAITLVYQDIVRNLAGRIGLIPRVFGRTNCSGMPIFLGKEEDLCIFCSDHLWRHLLLLLLFSCAIILLLLARSSLFHSLRTWFPHPQALRGKIELEVRQSPGLFPFKPAVSCGYLGCLGQMRVCSVDRE